MTDLYGSEGDLFLPVFESPDRVGDGLPAFVSRWKWRAERRCRDLNRHRLVPFYRFEVVPEEEDGLETGAERWAVVAFQNVAAPPDG